MKKIFFITFSLCFISLLNAQNQIPPNKPTIKKANVIIKKPVTNVPKKPSSLTNTNQFSNKNKKDSASYALGIKIMENLNKQGLDSLNVDAIAAGMKDYVTKNTYKIKDSLLDMCIGMYQQERMFEKSKEEIVKGQKFLEENKKRKEVVTLPSGLQYEVLKMSDNNIKPTLSSKIKCHYHGTRIDGTVFESSVERGQPAEFGLNSVIQGWQEGLPLMNVGSKYKFYIPTELAYGSRPPDPKIKPGATLIFEIELLEVTN